jgi:hypothetical protein
MDNHLTPPPELATLDEAAAPAPQRIGWVDGHLPEIVDPLVPRHPDTALAETRRLRHDGWTPEKKRRFLECFAECGVIRDACEAVGLSARSAYNLRDRDPLFAAGWEAAQMMARPRLADEVYSRALNGVVDRIYKDGMVVAERHRYDNRLTMAALARLDARIDRAEERGAPQLGLIARWDDYLDALEEDRREDGLALLAAPAAEAPEDEVHADAGDRELRELHQSEEADLEPDEDEDHHYVWETEGCWWTDYPPPPGFDGEEEGEYHDPGYRRTLASDEEAAIERERAEERAEALALAEAQRLSYFFDIDPDEEGGTPPPVPQPGEDDAEGP